jgi:uncharacterized membrane protein
VSSAASSTSATTGSPDASRAALRGPGIVLGVGLGGLVDGIVLHQILQWHHLLTSTDRDNIGVATYPRDTVRGLEVNTLWDGLFHAGAFVAVLAGVYLLYARSAALPRERWSSTPLWGWMLVGWGLFNVVEGVVDHHILGIHHVRSGPNETAYDLAFLAFGLLLIVGGWALARPRGARGSG